MKSRLVHFIFFEKVSASVLKPWKNPSVFGEGSSNPVILTLQIFFYNNNKKSNLFSFWEKRQFNKDLPSSSWRCNYLIKVLPFTSRSCNGMDSTILPKPRLLLGGCAKPYTSIEIAYPRPPPPWFSKVTTKLSLNVLFFGKRGGEERHFRKALPHTILQFKGGNNTGQSNPNRPFL